MNIHPDVMAAHAQFGGDLETMQKLYEHPALAAENTKLKADLAKTEKERDELVKAAKAERLVLKALKEGAEARAEAAEARLAQGEPVAWTFPSAEEFARATRMARGSEGLRAFARRVGVSPTTLCRIESGGEPDMKTARAIASAFPAAVQPTSALSAPPPPGDGHGSALEEGK